jgi:predicted nucleotide-binding protein
VVIGHGRSLLWNHLKDFIQDRLHLPWDEFNRVPSAGVTNVARLSEMLDAAAVAFVILTAEDERKDGTTQARMNAIHEVGLFQGKLGFRKAIVLLEEGCEAFSNIKAAFEGVRQVLKREGLLDDLP